MLPYIRMSLDNKRGERRQSMDRCYGGAIDSHYGEKVVSPLKNHCQWFIINLHSSLMLKLYAMRYNYSAKFYNFVKKISLKIILLMNSHCIHSFTVL